MKKRKTLILMLSLVCLLVVGIGFAAIAAINLKVDGSATFQPNPNAYKVEFTAASKTAGGTDAVTIDTNDKTKATINVTSLNTKGTSVTFTLTITNNSSDDIAATISALNVTETDTANAFSVTTTGGSTTIQQNGTTDITVTVTLDIAPIDTVSGSFEVSFTATPALAD